MGWTSIFPRIMETSSVHWDEMNCSASFLSCKTFADDVKQMIQAVASVAIVKIMAFEYTNEILCYGQWGTRQIGFSRRLEIWCMSQNLQFEVSEKLDASKNALADLWG